MLDFTRQLVFDGIVNGLVIGLLAMGIVLVHRSTRIVNFAVANMGLVGSALFALLVARYGVPFWIGLPIALLAGAAFAAAIELTVIRRLFAAPRVIMLVATIGIAQLALAIVTAYPEIDAAETYPVWSSDTWHPVAGVAVTATQAAVLVVVPAAALLLGWFLNRTLFGKAVTGSADNPRLARLNGISPKAVSTAVWAIAGLLATVALILVSGRAGSVSAPAVLGMTTLMRALAAAAIARMTSFRIALLAGAGLGLLESVVQYNWLNQPGLIDLVVLVLVLVAVFALNRGSDGDGGPQAFAAAPRSRPVPERLRGIWWVRNIDRIGLLALGVVAVVVPLVVTQPSRHLLYTTILAYAICGSSVTVLSGWAGQLSLGQMSFAGIGALTAAALSRGLRLDIGSRVLVLEPLTFPTAVAAAAATTTLLAAVIGAGALRVRGLLLAVSTLAFAVACEQWVYRQDVFHDGPGLPVATFPRRDVFGIDVGTQRSYYYLVLVVLVLVLALVGRLRRTGIGRTTIGVRDNPATASAYTVSPARVKLRAFALAGGIAGIGGALLAGALGNVPYGDAYFRSGDSLILVSVVVIGGLGSTAGPVLGALWVVGLPALFPGNSIAPLLASGIGLLILLLYFPGGLIRIPHAARDALLVWAERRLPEAPQPEPRRTTAAALARAPRTAPPADRPLLTSDGLRVRFGGVTAVDGVSIDVMPDEIVGLIGTNGAGKSTLMNALGGYLPADGTVRLLGTDVSGKSPARRAALGLGRTFQAATLFPELTVRETVKVALEARGRTGLLSAALCLPTSLKGERAKSSDADDLIGFLGLGRYADAFIGDLSTGTRRIVELAGLLALDARVLCLDEPTAGVAQRETEAFGPLLHEIRRELGAAMLVIEHDMPLIMGISDRVYCLETGRVIAAGTPDAVRDDPKVIASYLGTDERAILRSGEAP